MGIIGLALVVGYLIWAMIQAQNENASNVCNAINIQLTDSAQRYYTSANELNILIREHGLKPTGRSLNQINAHAIEQLILTHPMVKTAMCYTTTEHVLKIKVTQRQPLLKVESSNGIYYIDTDRKRMPVRESIQTTVLKIVGNVGERMAKQELADMVEWIYNDHYWIQRIAQVEVIGPKMIVLQQKDNQPKLILGDIEDYEQKLNKVRKFQQAEVPNEYKELDTRFYGQIVGRK